MDMLGRARITGCSEFKFTNDTGENVEGYHVFVEVDMSADQGCYGNRTQSYKATKPIVDQLKGGAFPFNAELQLRQTATRGKTAMEVVGVKRLDAKA